MQKNWQDLHFKISDAGPKRLGADAPKTVPQGSSSLPWLLLVLFAGSSVVGADYLGFVQLGIFARPQPAPVVERPRVDPPAPAFVATPEPQLPSQPVSLPPEVIAAPAPDPTKVRQLQAKIAQLDRGLNLMSRDLAEVRAHESPHRWNLQVRPLPSPDNRGDGARSAPFTAAERVMLCEEYARANPGASSQDAYAVNNAHNAALADLANARTRLKELTDKEASLQSRIAKAKAEQAKAASELTNGPP